MVTRYQRLLLEILRVDLAKRAQPAFLSFSPDDWIQFVDASIKHRLSSQVSEYLSRNVDILKLVPVEGHARLRRATWSILQHNFSQYQRVRVILGACEQARVPVLLFKGLWLVDNVYRSPKARSSGDIDLLVQPDDMTKFTRVARDIGCLVPDGAENLQALAPASNEYSLCYRNKETVLDIHWAVTHPLSEASIDVQEIWSRAESTKVAGLNCLAFRLEDHLLYLCYHIAIHHRFADIGPRAFLDIAKFIENPPRPIDWVDFVDRAQKFSWSRGVWLTLDLVRETIGASPPTFVFEELRPRDTPDSELRGLFIDAIFLDQSNDRKLSRNIAHLIDAPWADKLTILTTRLFPPRAEIATRYGLTTRASSFHFHYAKRIMSMMRMYSPTLFQTIVRNPTRVMERRRMSKIDSWLRVNG